MQLGTVVERLEVHFVLGHGVVAQNAGGAVRFVGDGEIEAWSAVPGLGFANPPQRVVGTEHGLDGAGTLAQKFGDCRRIGNHVAHQRVGTDLEAFAAPAGGAVRAHHQRGHGPCRMRQPLAPSLRHQSDGGRGEKYPPVVRHDALGQPQRRERLAGSTRHHQLATRIALRDQAIVGGVNGPLLKRLRLALFRRLAQLTDFEVEELQKVDAGNSRLAPGNRPLRSRVPLTGGDDPTQPERRTRGFVQEAIHLPLADHRVFGVALALDGDHRAVRLNRDEIDAVVASIETREPLPLRPVAPRPHVRHVELRVVAHGRHEQMLEPSPLLRLAGSFATNASQHVTHPLAGAEIDFALPPWHWAMG